MELHLDLRKRGRFLLETGALFRRVRPVPREPLPRPCRRHLPITLVERALPTRGKPIFVLPLHCPSIDPGMHSGSECSVQKLYR